MLQRELAKKGAEGAQSLAKAVGWRGRECHPDEQEGRLWGQRMRQHLFWEAWLSREQR